MTPKLRIVRDTHDGYSPLDPIPGAAKAALFDVDPVVRDDEGAWGVRAWLAKVLHLNFDGYQNKLTGLGDPSRDKTYGGRYNGPDFVNQFLSGWEAQERWRGSDLGGRIVETVPREMTRRGWTISIQPDADDKTRADDFPAPQPKAVHTPGELPEVGDDNTAIIEELVKEQDRLKLNHSLFMGGCYERAYGGAGVLIGVDDGGQDLVTPLDPRKVRRITHLTPFRGGWDGELIAWRYYVDPRHPKYGQPAVYQLRNLGVTVNTPAPGESPDVANETAGFLLCYVHESRLLLFPGNPVSHWACVQMRGWGDAIWIRINQILSQYSGSWEGVAILMQEYGLPLLSMDKFSEMMSTKDGAGLAVLQNRAMAMQMAMSIARTRIIDSKEKLERVTVQLAGVAEVLREFALRLAAAAGMPLSLLMGQVQGGLGDAAKGDVLFFYDQVAGMQNDRILPLVQRFTALQLAAQQGPTNGQIPKRWSVKMNPLMQMTDQETADYRYKIAQTDQIYINEGVITPEEAAGTRFGGSDFNDGPIVLDMEGRAAMAKELPEPSDPVLPPEPNTLPTLPLAPTQDSADFVERNGRQKIRTAVSLVAVFNSEGQLLFGRRRDSGKWAFPGGHAEPGEDALSCAIRELREETGLTPKRFELLGTKTVGGALHKVHLTVYQAMVDGEPEGARDPDQEFDRFVWADVPDGRFPPEIGDNLHHPKDAVGPMLRRR